jgi:cellulose 1,4-beta-cellobiosidase
MVAKFAALAALLGVAAAQQVGTQTTETHPKMTWSKCSSGGSCTTVNGEVTIDANWRWVHDKGGYSNCYTGNAWNTTICKDSKSCASNCALDGGMSFVSLLDKSVSCADKESIADYPATYGATTSGNALTLKFVTKGQYGEYTRGNNSRSVYH